MRTTLAKIGGLALTALVFAHCESHPTGGTGPNADLGTDVDLSGSDTTDLSTTSTDLPTTSTDMATVPGVPVEFTVVRIGTGAAALTNDATAAFLERRKIADGTLVGTALPLPTAVNGANKQLTLSGLASVEGQLSRSVDGKYLVIVGYAANPGERDISRSSSTTYNRVIGRIDAANTINTATASTAYNAASARGVATTDGNMLWLSSDVGIGYTTLNSTAVPVTVSLVSTRFLGIFGTNNGTQLYATSGSTTYQGVNAVGTGTPTTSATVTRLPGFTDLNSESSVGFAGLDRDNNGTVDQLYVADDRFGGGGGVQRWRLNGATWTRDGTISTGATAGAHSVAVSLSGNTVTLLITTSESFGISSRILQLTDNGGATTAVTSKLLATAGTNTVYRGIALAPIP